MKRKLFSLLLVLAMLLSMGTGAFAAHVTPEISESEIQAGQTIDVILKINEEVPDIVALQYDVYFDAALFDYTSSVRGESNAKTTISTQKTDAATGETYYSVLYVDNSAEGDPQTFTVGTLYTLTFTAKQDISETAEASFRVLEKALDTHDFESLRDADYQGTLSVRVKAGEEPPAVTGYSVAISEDQTKNIGETATVNVAVNSSEYDSYNTVDMSFNYDADKLELNTTEIEGYILRTGDGTIRVMRYGQRCPIGDAFELVFKCIAAGEARVELTSAYVDNSSGAATQDIPPATITAGTVTITISSPTPHTHTYGEPTWSWAGDYSYATATFTCTDNDDTQTVTDNAPTETVVTAASCTADKVVKYTAKVTFNGTEYTDTTDNVTLPNTATGHSYGEPEWSWIETSNGYTVKAKFTCSACNDVQIVSANVTSATKDATCTEAGKTTYTATATFGGKNYTGTKEVEIAALGHDWGEWVTTVEPTSTTAGEKQHTCSRCGETEKETIPATGGGGGGGGGTPTPTTYEISIPETEHGEVTVEPQKAAAGAEVTLTVTPDEGYELAEITVTDENGNEIALTENEDSTYTFQMPNGPVTVTAKFKPAQSVADRFIDVHEGDWFYDAVYWAADNGLMIGTGNSMFSPNLPLTRGMVATVLYRMEGEPEAKTENPFSDVEDGQWYTDAVNWAAENGIVLGYPDGTFAPLTDITREQLAAIMMRYAAYKGRDVTVQADLSSFADGDDVSGWAKENVSWAVAVGLIKGRDGNRIAPLENATRAEAAMVFMRLDAYLA